jgi:hypothetical protein
LEVYSKYNSTISHKTPAKIIKYKFLGEINPAIKKAIKCVIDQLVKYPLK